MLKAKYILFFLLISSSWILITSLFSYLQPSCGEAEEGAGCYAPNDPIFKKYWAYAECGKDCTKTTDIDITGRQFIFCYLSGAAFDNLDDDGGENAYCAVFLDTSVTPNIWKVRAVTSDDDDPSAWCQAHCIYLN